MSLIQNQWHRASDRHQVKAGTIAKREWAQKPGARRSRAYRERYGGGKRATPPVEANLLKWGVDSGRLVGGLKMTLQASKSKGTNTGRINVPANRLEQHTFGDGYERWAADLRQRVPLMAGNLDAAIRDPEVRADLQAMMDTIAEGAVIAGNKRIDQLVAERNRQLLGLLKQLARIAAAA